MKSVTEKQENIKVSVLVPTCNVEKYVERCLLSIVSQTLKGIEVILLDDGSTDRSGGILDWYAAQREYFRVIHKPNSGYGATMNRGLQEARGKYIGCVESDDFATPEMFECMYEAAEQHQADAVFCNFYEFTRGKDRFCNNLEMTPTGEVYSLYSCPDLIMKSSVGWAGLYRAKFLRENDIDWNETPGASFQDSGFQFKVQIAAKRIYSVKEPICHYRQDRPGQSVKTGGKVFCTKDEFDSVWRYIEEHSRLDERAKYLIPYIQFFLYNWNLNRLTLKEQNEFFPYVLQDFQRLNGQGVLREEYWKNKKLWQGVQRLLITKKPIWDEAKKQMRIW